MSVQAPREIAIETGIAVYKVNQSKIEVGSVPTNWIVFNTKLTLEHCSTPIILSNLVMLLIIMSVSRKIYYFIYSRWVTTK